MNKICGSDVQRGGYKLISVMYLKVVERDGLKCFCHKKSSSVT